MANRWFHGVALLACFSQAGAADEPVDRIQLFDGTAVDGSLLEFGDRIRVRTARMGDRRAIPLADILRIERSDSESPAPMPSDDRRCWVQLTDRSWVGCRSYRTEGGVAKLDRGSTDVLEVPIDAVEWVVPRAETRALAQRVLEPHRQSASVVGSSTDRLLVVRGGAVHAVEGVVGAVDAQSLTFLVEGDAVRVGLDGVLAWSHSRKRAAEPATMLVEDRRGNVWGARAVKKVDDRLEMTTPHLGTRTIPWSELLVLDAEPGRVVRLVDAEPTAVRHTPFFDVGWTVRRFRESLVAESSSGLKGPQHGLVIHSRTQIEYRLGGQYRRFASRLAIHENAGRWGDALVRIRGDERVLFETRVKAGEPAIFARLAIGTVDRFEILVDYADGLDLGDQVVFGEAHWIR